MFETEEMLLDGRTIFPVKKYPEKFVVQQAETLITPLNTFPEVNLDL